MPKYSKVMLVFGGFLIVCGFLGWAATGFTPRGATAIGSGSVTGVLMLAMGLLSSRPGRVAKSIGVHVGFVLSLLFGCVFVWRALVGWGLLGDGAPKPAVAALISVMAVVSFVTFAALLAMRPRPEDRKPAGA